MKKVLISVDYNPTSETVIKEGYQLAKTLGATVCMLHVVADVSYYGMQYPSFMGFDSYTMPMNPDLAENRMKVSENFLKAAAEHLNDPTVEIQLETGDTADTILMYAKIWQADMIVLGTHSHSTLEKLFMGTVASSVIEKTEIPVYLVPIKKDSEE